MKPFLSAALLLAACPVLAPAAVTYYCAYPYYGRNDSPFHQGIVDGTIYLEDFEDYKLNTPYVTSTGGGWVADSPANSVDEDDGKDGIWNKGGGAWRLRPSDTILPEFTFSISTDGLLPSYVGMALLGGRFEFPGSSIYTQLLAYDSNGVEITNGEWKVVLPLEPPGAGHSSASDAFVGIYFPEGISRIKVGWALIDHLQYGYAIPEPGAAGLLAAAAAGFGLTVRRRGTLRRC